MTNNKNSNAVLKRKSQSKLYCKIKKKMILNIIVLLILFGCLIYAFSKSFLITKSNTVTYNEKSNVDYKVYLKDNNFYDKSYLNKGMAYVTSLIDNIKIKYNYTFDSTIESDLDIKYKIIGKLVIASQNNSKTFYEKEYDLSKEIIDEMVNEKSYIIDRDVEIDYQYYNNLANEFKSNYAVNTTSRLEVSLHVEETNKESNSYELNSINNVVLSIPLSEQEINISLDNTNLNNSKNIVLHKKIVVKDISFVIISAFIILMIIFTFISLIEKIYLLTQKNLSAYDKHIRRILLGYDRIIVNVMNIPNKDDYNLIEVENFQELVDVRDNTKEPINYHVIKEHSMCEFFVINGDNLYLYEVNASTLNKDD